MRSRKYDLEERLVDFGASIIDVVETLPNTQAGSHIVGQLVRSGTSTLSIEHSILDISLKKRV